jgi:hypothetical protein
MKAMKTKILILFSFLLIATNLMSQDFETKPYLTIDKWITNDYSIEKIKTEIPEGFVLYSEDSKMLYYEKKVNDRIYELKVYITDSKITGVMFTDYFERVFRLLDEIEKELKFKQTNELVNNGIEMLTYENSDKTINASMTINRNNKTLKCFYNKK